MAAVSKQENAIVVDHVKKHLSLIHISEPTRH